MPLRKDILVRGIPVRLHKRMKMEALRQDKTLSDLTVTAFEHYLKCDRRRQNPGTPKNKACN